MIAKLIASEIGESEAFIEWISHSANYRYKDYVIRKRTGGWRKISQPAKSIKFMQRWLVRNLFHSLPVHDSATAYKPNASIWKNAHAHASSNYLLKMDFTDFFPSICGDDVRELLRKSHDLLEIGLQPPDVDFIVRIVCRHNQLTIGAPSSPAISNYVMFEFDNYISDFTKNLNVAYTRYADDLAFSTNEPRVLEVVAKEVERLIRGTDSPNLAVNQKKTVFTSRKHKKFLTGLVLTPQGSVSLGRKRKRYIRSLIFKYLNQDLLPADISYLRGFLAFAKDVEPDFLSRLAAKYGENIIGEIRQAPLTSTKPRRG